MPLNLTNFAPILKTLFTPSKVENLVYKGNPFLASLPKKTDFYGSDRKVPMIYGNPQGRSASFTTAQGNKGNTASIAFLVTRNKDYQLLSIDGETLKASANDAGAFLAARKTEIENGFKNITSALSVDVFGNGSGVRGQILAGSAINTSTLTLSDRSDIVKFEVGMQLQVSSANGGGAVRTGTMFVVSVNRSVGSFVVAATAGGAPAAADTLIAAIAASDFILAAGDYDAKLKGLQAWLVYGGVSSTTFFGVNRTTDSERLAGVWSDLSALPIEEALIEAGTQMQVVGSMVDRVWMNPVKMADLVKSLGAKVQYVDMKIGEIGFRGVQLQLNDSVVEVFSDRNCPKERMFFLQTDSWLLHSLGEAPGILNLDTLEALREATSDGIEIRIGHYSQLVCTAPGYNGVFKI